MRIVLPALEEDLYAKNKNNKFVNEPHTLANKRVRGAVPINGLFFEDSLVVRDKSRILIPDEDYKLSGLDQDIFDLTGMAAYAIILIQNPDVGKDITIDYHAVGGHYARNTKELYKMHANYLFDDRPIEYENIRGMEPKRPPTAHMHNANDIYGWGGVIFGLERIRDAIALKNLAILVEMTRSMIGEFSCGELDLILPTSKVMTHDAMLYVMSSNKMLSDVSVRLLGCNWRKGRSVTFAIDTTDLKVGSKVYWSFYKENRAKINLAVKKNGVVKANGGIVHVSLYVPTLDEYLEETLYIGVNTDIMKTDYEAVTYRIKLKETRNATTGYDDMVCHLGVDSDFANDPGVYIEPGWEQTHYQLEHLSNFRGLFD